MLILALRHNFAQEFNTTNTGKFYFPGDIHGAELSCNFHFMELPE